MELNRYDIRITSPDWDRHELEKEICSDGEWYKVEELKKFLGIGNTCEKCAMKYLINFCHKFGKLDGNYKRHPKCIEAFGE